MRRGNRGLTVLGGYGGINTGDEMILRALVSEARAAGYRGTINVVCALVPQGAARAVDYDRRDLKAVSWRNVLGAAHAAMGRDLFIGGGQIVDGVAGIQFPLVKLGVATVARMTGGRVTIGGVSTARLDKASVRRGYDKLFRIAGRIVTRDAASTADIVAITPSAARKVRTEADLVFSLEGELRGQTPAGERQVIAFGVHRSPTLDHTGFGETLDFLRRLDAAAAGRYRIAILAHDMRSDCDLGLAERLAAEIGSPNVAAVTLPTTDECVAFYKQARCVVSARMHPIILGACAGAFCVPLASSRKVADMAARLGVPQRDLRTLAELPDEAFSDALGLSENGPLPDSAAVRQMAAEARRVVAP